MKWIKADDSTSSSQTLIIPCLPCLEKIAFSQFRFYIEAQTMNQCFCALITKRLFSFKLLKAKKSIFCILHMLSIHTGLRTWSGLNVYELNLFKKINLISVYHALISKRVTCYLNNIEWLLIGTNITLRLEMMIQ